MLCASCGYDNPDINRFCGMCGSILDRRRTPANDNVVPMPARNAEEQPRSDNLAPPIATSVERKPAQLSDEHFSAAAGPVQYEDDRPFSIFGVDTGAPLHASDVPQGLHGASFLGLGDADSSGDYLLEDEQSHAGRKFLLMVVLLVVGALAYLQYRADTPVTSIWAAIKSRATGQSLAKEQPREPAAAGVQPTQPTSAKPETAQPPENAANQPTAEANAQNPAANSTPTPTDEGKTAQAQENPSNKPVANTSEESAAPAAKASQKTEAEKSARGKKESAETMAKAQRPQSDEDAASQDEETASKLAAGKSSAAAARRDQEGNALVSRAQGFLYGKGGAKSCSTALSLLKQAAGRGNAKADSQLGAMYATGNCAPFDRAEAYRWFSKAAEAEPNNSYLQRSRDMIWREMSPQERRKVLE